MSKTNSKPGANGAKIWTYAVRGASVEATQRGYLVSAIVDGGKVPLASYPCGLSQKSIDAAYGCASRTATSIKRGAFVGSYGAPGREKSYTVDGRTLTVKTSGIFPR